jgi:hypothetical protein
LGCSEGMRAWPMLTPCACVHAGGDRVAAPYMHVPGVTPKQPMPHSDNKGKVTALVFITRTAGTFVWLTTGTRGVPGLYTPPDTPYRCMAGEVAVGMTRAEYTHGLSAAIQHFSKCPQFRERQQRWTLVHDGARTHLPRGMHKLHAGGQPVSINVITQPPRSPDVMPLDYSVFGAVKRKLKAARRLQWTWPHRAAEFLREHDTRGAIDAFPKRLQQLADAGGGHFE